MKSLTNNKNILIFEDDIDLVTQWMNALSKNGHTVCHALTVDEAKAHCNKMQFDLVILDICIVDHTGELALRGGFTLLSHLRQNQLHKMPKWTSTVPVLVVTGNDQKMGFDPLNSAKNYGGAHLTETLRKPFKPEQLCEKVSKILKKHIQVQAV